MNSAAWFIIVSALAGVCEQRNQQRPSLINFQAIEIDAMCGHGNGLQAKKARYRAPSDPAGCSTDLCYSKSVYRHAVLVSARKARALGGRHFRPHPGPKPN